MLTWARAPAITRRSEAEVPPSPAPKDATTMVHSASSRTMTPVSATSPSSAPTVMTMGSARFSPRATST